MFSNSNVQLPPLNPQQNSEETQRKRVRKSRACDLCRRKKIRCDYDQDYPKNSCSSCKSYQKECTFNEAAKKRGPPKGYVEGLEDRLKRMEQLLLNIAANGNLPVDAVQAAIESDQDSDRDSSQSDDNSFRNSQSGQELRQKQQQSQQIQQPQPQDQQQRMQPQIQVRHQTQHHHHQQQQQQQQQNNIPQLVNPSVIDSVQDSAHDSDISNCTSDEKEPFSYVGSSSGIYLLSRLFTKNIVDTDEQSGLPRPLDGHEEDLMIARYSSDRLNKLGFDRILNPDWKIPAKDLTDHLIKLYFKYINPLLPILDEVLFYEEYCKANPAHYFIPIIMSVCRISCRLLTEDDPYLKKHNLHRTAFFHDLSKQIQLCFHLDFLEPKIESIQVLLLNAMNAAEWGLESKDWIAVSIAVKMAQDLGLHRANTQTDDVLKRETEAKKRLWWSVYVSDRWFSCVMDRPLAIGDSDCNVDLPLIHGPSGNEDFTVFVQFIKLTSILGEVFRRIYTPKAKKNGYKTKAMEQILWSLEKYLDEWFSQVPDGYKLTKSDVANLKTQPNIFDGTKKVEEGGLLTVCYYAVIVLLHRPFMDIGKIDDMPCLTNSSDTCTNAAISAIDVARVIPSNVFARFGWNFAAHSVFEATLIHIYHSTHSDPVIQQTAKEYIDIAIKECLDPLIKVVPAAPPLNQYLQVMFMLMNDQQKLNKLA